MDLLKVYYPDRPAECSGWDGKCSKSSDCCGDSLQCIDGEHCHCNEGYTYNSFLNTCEKEAENCVAYDNYCKTDDAKCCGAQMECMGGTADFLSYCDCIEGYTYGNGACEPDPRASAAEDNRGPLSRHLLDRTHAGTSQNMFFPMPLSTTTEVIIYNPNQAHRQLDGGLICNPTLANPVNCLSAVFNTVAAAFALLLQVFGIWKGGAKTAAYNVAKKLEDRVGKADKVITVGKNEPFTDDNAADVLWDIVKTIFDVFGVIDLMDFIFGCMGFWDTVWYGLSVFAFLGMSALTGGAALLIKILLLVEAIADLTRAISNLVNVCVE